jgi:hypothetical protein
VLWGLVKECCCRQAAGRPVTVPTNNLTFAWYVWAVTIESQCIVVCFVWMRLDLSAVQHMCAQLLCVRPDLSCVLTCTIKGGFRPPPPHTHTTPGTHSVPPHVMLVGQRLCPAQCDTCIRARRLCMRLCMRPCRRLHTSVLVLSMVQGALLAWVKATDLIILTRGVFCCLLYSE